MSRLAKGFIAFWVLLGAVAVVGLASGGIKTWLGVAWLVAAVCGILFWVLQTRSAQERKRERPAHK